MQSEAKKITVSPLHKTWIFDLDGTILKHNGYKIDGHDSFLPGAKDFLQGLSPADMILFVTSRPKELAEVTEKFLAENKIRYDSIIYGAPFGERLLLNDKKPSGLPTAVAVNLERDKFVMPLVVLDENL